MPDFDTGLLNLEWDESGVTSGFDATALGEAYYNLGAENEAGTAMFWWDVMQEYLPQNDINFSDWMENYGDFLPQDYHSGYSQLARGRRLGQQGLDILHKEKQNEAASERHKYGATGFAGSGRQGKIGENIWSSYSRDAMTRRMSGEEMEEGIYAEQGGSILDQLSFLGEQNAFAPEGGEDTDYMSSSLIDDTWETGTGWADAVGDFCDACNAGDDNIYCSMCEGYQEGWGG